MTTPQWAIRPDGDLEIVDVPDPTHRLTEPATVTPGTDNKPTSLIETQAITTLGGRHYTDPRAAYIAGYLDGHETARQESGAHYYPAEDGTHHRTGAQT